jgi:hypothetical protein
MNCPDNELLKWIIRCKIRTLPHPKYVVLRIALFEQSKISCKKDKSPIGSGEACAILSLWEGRIRLPKKLIKLFTD